jgi:hypothetical protein
MNGNLRFNIAFARVLILKCSVVLLFPEKLMRNASEPGIPAPDKRAYRRLLPKWLSQNRHLPVEDGASLDAAFALSETIYRQNRQNLILNWFA